MATLQITFSGGFHRSADKTIRAEVVGDTAYVSPRQCRDLWRHFCGISDCACGGISRADAYSEAGWDIFRPSVHTSAPSVVAERS